MTVPAARRAAAHRFIAHANMPPRVLPWRTIVVCLLLDRIGAPGWAFGAVLALGGLLWVAEIYRLAVGTSVDLLPPTSTRESPEP